MPDIDTQKRFAFVTAHPAHLLTVVGMLLRYRPSLLFLTKNEAGPGSIQHGLIREGLAMLDFEDRVATLDFDEPESYRRALAGDFSFHLRMESEILDWLRAEKPQVVFGDAFEMSNYQHDTGRLMLDTAITTYRAERPELQNYEFPLSSRADHKQASLEFGRFADGHCCKFHLTQEEAEKKEAIVALAMAYDPFVARVAPLFPDLKTELYRPVPPDRDYSVPIPGLARHYDQRGREEVAAGTYTQANSFEDHFLPLVRALAKHRSAAA